MARTVRGVPAADAWSALERGKVRLLPAQHANRPKLTSLRGAGKVAKGWSG